MFNKFISIIIVSLFFCASSAKAINTNGDDVKKPVLYINKFSATVKDGSVLRCSKLSDLSVTIFYAPVMDKYDIVKFELHRFGTGPDEMVAFRRFTPSSKEFKDKFASKDSVRLKVLYPETDFLTSDFEVNTLAFHVSDMVNDVFCTFKEKSNNSFYIVIKGYMKTGGKDQFGVDNYDEGVEISPHSVTFKNWEDPFHKTSK